MLYRLLADAIIIIHLIFILFVISGGLLLLRNKRWSIVHLPATFWAVIIEFKGWMCPLTPLENWFREKGGNAIYQGDFIEHYLLPIIYPADLTKELQIIFGLSVIIINIAVYIWVLKKTRVKV
ncbi:MAG: DUF2784 domain-containing protein [Proteobacteria bacterium]|nr:DUF2784 domain-containing protein [Desulfobacteraceae bacterium]MBU3980204.1 DUF2784 domain-containing protein [Pseudomonadota bacterium]MBU4013609.1 DUF2784 domain-containing protein [Pseudomonadota bacterium]MBU4067383.1 DUF2784 domain-containing protein [Pseudomonadota bacterium]MBU4101804.1 DUF2784 domain-containing protein [Pseudomonadota bacterium]